MGCHNCFVRELEFDILVEGENNRSYILNIMEHLKRRKIAVERNENILTLKESGVKEFLDFCVDHMNPGEVSFRFPNQAWQELSKLEGILEMQWIDEVIKKELIICYFQPIVNKREEVFAYELLSRFRKEDGSIICPNIIFEAARSRGRLYALDRLCRMTAVRYAAQLEEKKAFINFIPTSIYSPELCLQSTIRTATKLGIDPSQPVFEVVETEKVDDLAHLKKILAYYKEKGFEYALNDVGEGYSTIGVLEDIRPQYMKPDMKYVQGVAGDKKASAS
jgi:EAL domain-containing protein (putative c-di-GMP-specific phosphodiesterase class I)